MDTSRRLGAAVLVLVVLLLAVTAFGLVVVDKPRIQSVDNSWGTVTSERSEVETRIAVDNPLLLRVVDSVANVRYTVTLNGIVFATEREKRVRLSGRDDVVTVSTWMSNDRIPRWWVTHVNRNETTTVTVDPDVVVKYGGVEAPADEWTRNRTFQTDLLEPLETDRPRRFSAFGRPVFVVKETNARWGQATRERTPIHASIRVTNLLSVPLPITEIRYTVRMNGIVVGQGTAGRQMLIPAESTRTLEARADIDNSKLDRWWVTHLRRNETSELSVDFTATVEYNGVERQFPLEFASYNRTFRTDIFRSAEGSGPAA